MKTFKFRLFLFFIVFDNFILLAQVEENPEKIKNSKIQIEKIVMYRFTERGDSIIDAENTIYFDREGFRTEYISKWGEKQLYKYVYDKGKINLYQYFIQDKLHLETKYDYDEYGHELKYTEVVYTEKEKGNDTSVTINEFNESGIKTVARTYKKSKNNELSLIKYFIYDKAGNLINEESYNADGSIDSWRTYNYDEYNRKINFKLSRDMFFTEYQYKYDEKNDVIERTRFAENGSVLSKENYKYDDNGILLRIDSFDGNNKKDYLWIYNYVYYE